MSFCSYSKEFAAMNFTSVENAYIYEYLPEATGNAVKVYLYGLFLCQNADFDVDLAAFARELKLTEAEVRDAFTYWEEFGLVSVISGEPLSVKYLPIGTGVKPRRVKPEKYAAFTESAQALLPARMIPPNEFNEYFNIMEVYGIKPEAFLMIIKYCTDLKGEDIGYKYISAVAKDFGARKILTPEQVEKELSAYILRTSELEKLLKALSLRRKPEIDDLNYFNKWTKELGYEPENVLFAAKSMKRGSMKKLDEFIGELYSRKVFSKQEIESYADTKKKLYELAVKINKALGVYYETLDAVVDNYTAPWTAFGFDEESLLFIANYCFKKRKNTLENMDEIVIFREPVQRRQIPVLRAGRGGRFEKADGMGQGKPKTVARVEFQRRNDHGGSPPRRGKERTGALYERRARFMETERRFHERTDRKRARAEIGRHAL